MGNQWHRGKLVDNVWQAALAGLLHDVGKVAQRAQSQPWLAPSDTPTEGQPVHAAWSVRFIAGMPEPYRAAALPGAYHHAPERSPARDKHLSELVALADKLSAGERADPEPDASKIPPRQLVTIFDRLALGGRQPRAENYLPLAPLRLSHDTLFPARAQDESAQRDAYGKLYGELEGAARENIADPQTYLENMLAAMQKTTWCVPSAYYHSIPDVSLYDHARMTAALAACLANWDALAVRELLDAVERDFHAKPQPGDTAILDKPVAVLIGGDISGVQDFIYTLSSKGAAKTLRGRSFYLQLLSEAILRYVLRELGLPYTNVIYSGGGNFFLLAPVSVAGGLSTIRQDVTRTLLMHHGTALYLALGQTVVPARGFRRGAFKEHWDAMHRAIGEAKQKRYIELGDELYARVFEPLKHGGNQENTCAVCGDESENVSLLEEEGRRDKICPLCASFEKLGGRLTNATFVVLGFSAPQETVRGDASSALRAFGMQLEFARLAQEEIAFADQPERTVVWALDDAERFPTVREAPTARMTRYTVNWIPRLSFDELQGKADGIERLGVLRMDVDNLGDLFGKGFGEGAENLATLSRISTLSFQLTLFFEGWVKTLCAKQAALVYTVYAGGDDVFLIAPWSIVPDLARAIVADLKAYTANNPDVHLSAGMAFIGGKYPVYQAAEDAKDALDQAKAVVGKDAFSIFHQAWKWKDFAGVQAKFGRLKTLVGKPGKVAGGLGAPEAILQTLRQFALDEADKARRHKGKPVWGKWMWLGAYKLTRDAERERTRKPDVAKELLAIRDELSANEYREIGQWGAAARWAQLWLREK